MRLRSTLAATFGAIALVAGLAASLVVENQASQRAREQTGQKLADLAAQIRDGLDRGMYGRWRDIRVLSTVARTADASPETRRLWVEALRRSHGHYSWIAFMTPEGVVSASTGGILEGQSVAARPWFQAALQGPHVGDVHEAKLLAKLLPASPDGGPLRFLDVAAPVYDVSGRLESVLGAHLSWAWARDVERGVLGPASARHPGLEAIIVRTDGEVILGPAAIQGQKIDVGAFKFPPPPALEPSVRDALTVAEVSPDQAVHTRLAMDDGTPFLAGASRSLGFADYPGLGWTVIVRQRADIALAPVEALRRQILIGGGLFAVLIAATGWWCAGRIAKPLLAVADAAGRIERAEQADERVIPARQGIAEVDALSASLRTLLGRLAERDAALERGRQALEARVEERTRDLVKSEAFVRGIVDASPDCVKVLDLTGAVTFINGNGVCLLEAEGPSQIVGQDLAGLWPEDGQGLMAARIQWAAQGDLQRFTTFCPTAVGNPKWWDISLTPILDPEGRPERVLAVSRDITLIKFTEEELKVAKLAAEQAQAHAEAASQAKTDFLASMSHEIRTPLNGVLGYTEILLDARDSLAEPQRRAAERIQSAGTALLTVVNDILDFSKIEAGQIELDPQSFALNELVQNTVAIVEGLAKAKRLTVSVSIDAGLPMWFVGDQDRIRQVLLNLLNNAVKFTPMGGITLQVTRLDTGGGAGGAPVRLRFAVSDTGIGIPQDKQARLFQRFSQVDGSIRREFGGTGLGLAISKNLVELMGGTIAVTSEQGKGSTFSFEVSLPEAEAGTIEAAPSCVVQTSRPARILLVEDLVLNQELANHVLTAAGHSVDIVGDGADAVMAVQTKAYDLVLMDIQMPGMDGLTATRHIRALDNPARSIPIVALTANVMPAQIAEFQAAGMNDHTGKPFKRVELLQAVERCLAAAPPAADAAEAPAPEAPDFDRGVFDDLVELAGPDQGRLWVRRFQEVLSSGILGDGSDATDPALLARTAHALVSQAGMLGFTRLSTLASRLEEACLAGEPLDGPLSDARRAAVIALGDLQGLDATLSVTELAKAS